jgi:hypothetical protein
VDPIKVERLKADIATQASTVKILDLDHRRLLRYLRLHAM